MQSHKWPVRAMRAVQATKRSVKSAYITLFTKRAASVPMELRPVIYQRFGGVAALSATERLSSRIADAASRMRGEESRNMTRGLNLLHDRVHTSHAAAQICQHALCLQIERTPSLALFLHSLLQRWELTADPDSEHELQALLLRVGLTMPLTVRPPDCTKWNTRTLELFGLSNKALANVFSGVWSEVGEAVLIEANRRQTREKLEAERRAHAEQLDAERLGRAMKEKDELESGLTEFARHLSKTCSSSSDKNKTVFYRELQRIIALDSPPNSGCKHQAAVYKQFRWMALLHKELFMPEQKGGPRFETFMQLSGMRAEDCDAGFHSIDWQRSSKDGDVVDAWLEDWQHGVQRLRVAYCKEHKTQQKGEQPDALLTAAAQEVQVQHEDGKVVALCMYAPLPPSGLPQSRKDSLAECPLRLDDGSHVVIEGQVVTMIPFVLTLPRFELLRRFREAVTTSGSEGLQLTGVLGAGKSHTLEALSSVLLYGGNCDLFFHRASADLLDDFSNSQHLLEAVARCSGPLGTMLGSLNSRAEQSALVRNYFDGPRSVGSPSSALMSFMQKYDGLSKNSEPAALSQLKALFSYMKSNVPEGQARVIIMDEVHELLGAVGKRVGRTLEWGKPCGSRAYLADSVATFFEAWLEWKYGTGPRALRILSSSPHGTRESVSGIQLHPCFELRPPRADHLGALMAIAPEYLLGTGQPPQATAKGLVETQVAVQKAVAVCDLLGSNMRYVASYLSSVSEGSAHPTAASTVQHEMIRVLSQRLEMILSVNPESNQKKRGKRKVLNAEAGRSSPPLWESVLRDASLTVCLSQRNQQHRLIAGKTSILAACAALGSMASQGSAQSELAKALEHMTHQDLELQCAARVHLKLLTRQFAQLPNETTSNGKPSAAFGSLPANASPILSLGEKRLISDRVSDPAVDRMWSSAQSVGRMHFLMSNSTLQYSVLHEPVVSVCRKLLNDSGTPGGNWQRATIQTVHQFPGTDMIELDRNRTTCVVRLYKVTRSTIAQHAKGKRMLEYDAEGTNASEHADSATGASNKDDKAYAEIESVWGDVLALCGTPRHAADLQRDGSVKMTRLSSLSQEAAVGDTPVGSLAAGTSLVNTILCSLGVPLVVHRRIEVADGKIMHLDLSVEHCDDLCRELFGQTQGGDDAQWGTDGVTDWQLQVVYVSDTPQADNEADLLKHQSLVSLPFVRYVFREQMREVLPL